MKPLILAKPLLLISLSLILIVGGTFLIHHFAKDNTPWSGQVVFQTDADYIKFKQEIVALGMNHVQQMEVMSSAPPILVWYKAFLTDEQTLSVGTKESDRVWFESFLGSMLIVLIFVVVTASIIHL